MGVTNDPICSCNYLLEFQRPTLYQIIPRNYTLNISTVFGLTLDAFKKPQSNKLLSIISQTLYLDNYVKIRKPLFPNIQDFLQYLKSTYLLELKPVNSTSKKWELLHTLF